MAKEDQPKRYHNSNNRRIDDILLDVADQYSVQRYALLLSFSVYGSRGRPTCSSISSSSNDYNNNLAFTRNVTFVSVAD